MGREVSIRELRNHMARVVAAMRSGERLTLTVDGTAVADLVSHEASRSPWVSADVLRRLVAEAGSDAGLLTDLAGVRGP